MTTVADLLLRRGDHDGPALLFEDRAWTYRDLAAEGRRRAALHAELHESGRPPHVGVLLDNGPEYLFWLAGAALSGSVVVGINATYRGAQLRRLIDHTDCELLVTSSRYRDMVEGGGPENILVVDEPGYEAQVAAAGTAPLGNACEDDLFLLVFTSGSTGAPKAVRCTQGRFARTGAHVAAIADLGDGDVVYASLPFFHSSSLFTGWASALDGGIPVATRARFSARGTLPDVRRYGATMLTYTGKVLNYLLAVPEQSDDADNPLRLAIGNEASARDIRTFARRFGCTVRDSYGSTEGVIVIRRDPAMPDGALGVGSDTVRIVAPDTGEERPPVSRAADGTIANLDEAVGEIVETEPSAGFEGYYRNDEATQARFRGGWYWSGDLGYRDADGWLYFAGRSNEWLRVDGENFASAPVEAIIARHPAVRSVAVYAVPDDPVGDRVMAAVELWDGADLDPAAFDEFLERQPDLGPKWRPAFVRTTAELPKLASMKIDKTALRRQAWRPAGVLWRPDRGGGLRPLTAGDRRALEPLLTT